MATGKGQSTRRVALSRSPVRNLSQLQREDCENQKLSWDAGNLEDSAY